jgi:hypothetical protein
MHSSRLFVGPSRSCHLSSAGQHTLSLVGAHASASQSRQQPPSSSSGTVRAPSPYAGHVARCAVFSGHRQYHQQPRPQHCQLCCPGVVLLASRAAKATVSRLPGARHCVLASRDGDRAILQLRILMASGRFQAEPVRRHLSFRRMSSAFLLLQIACMRASRVTMARHSKGLFVK